MNTFFDQILRENQLHAVFQPIVTTADLAVAGYEGLIRGPDGSDLESPAALFACARAHGRQLELEQGCLRTIWTAFSKLRLPGKLFINASADMLLAPVEPGSSLLDYLTDLEVDGERVVIEITEEQAVTDYRHLRQVVDRLAVHGYELAIDDLGAGFASLRLWLELQPTYIKIDNSFVHGIDNDVVRRRFIDSIQQLAHSCGTRVIAEGIESVEQLEVLRGLGIVYGQGFYIGRPVQCPPVSLSCKTR